MYIVVFLGLTTGLLAVESVRGECTWRVDALTVQVSVLSKIELLARSAIGIPFFFLVMSCGKQKAKEKKKTEKRGLANQWTRRMVSPRTPHQS